MQEKVYEKYGVLNSQQYPAIALKAAKSSNISFILKHWRTNEEIVCVGSYEKKVVEYLNNHNVDYFWQPKTFKIKNGKTFRPDLYLIAKDMWIEIKGYFRKDALEKWNWFHQEHPNSELWDYNKLKELKIL